MIDNHITISNFGEFYLRQNINERSRILNALSGYSERYKWVDGRANIPIRVCCSIFKSKKWNILLKEARFSAKGVSSHFRVRLPQVINEEFSYFLGIIAGDGYIRRSKPGQRGGWTIQMCEDDYEFQTKIYIPLVERLFGSKLYISARKDGRRKFFF